ARCRPTVLGESRNVSRGTTRRRRAYRCSLSRLGQTRSSGALATETRYAAQIGSPMNSVTKALSAIEHGDPKAADELLPLVYTELRRLAAHKMAHVQPGQTLQPTALVHEAYLRLVGEERQAWDGRGHFFSAAAEAMRRILIE